VDGSAKPWIKSLLALSVIALIATMIFTVGSAAQRSARDRARQDMVSRAIAGLSAYAGNHNGAYPTASGDFAESSQAWFSTGLGQKLPPGLTVTQKVTIDPVTTPPAINMLLLYIGSAAPAGILNCTGTHTSGYVITQTEGGKSLCLVY
jgi:type II secretory pathway pseudopilin PulG